MCYDLTLIPKNLINGVIQTSDDLFIYVEETDIPEMKYEDLCYLREKIYVLSELIDLMR